MDWYPEEDEEELMFSPALLARRASESWIVEPPVEVLVAWGKKRGVGQTIALLILPLSLSLFLFLTLFADGAHQCDAAAQEVHARLSGAAACHGGNESRGSLRPGLSTSRGSAATD